jgi:phosphoglucomutase
LKIKHFKTTPYENQKPGTSGLRKKVSVFTQPNYFENYIESILSSLPQSQISNKTLVLGGDGRYFNSVAIQKTIQMAASKGFSQLIVPQNGMLSTPAASHLVRKLNSKNGSCCTGAIILTASHNPGGEKYDFGVKFNVANGSPANENFTDAVYERSKRVSEYSKADIGDIDLSQPNKTYQFFLDELNQTFSIDIVSPEDDYISYLKELFDFSAIQKLVKRKDFKFVFDSMNGVGGLFAKKIFHDELGVDISNLQQIEPKPDFGGIHPDPNLKHATLLMDIMGVGQNGEDQRTDQTPDFGVACDGDADR